jgi:hypothetical protein
MFLFRLFRFRSSVRDQETDKQRIGPVQKAVRSAIAGAEAEVIGLRTRIAKARITVTYLLAQIEDGESDATRRAQLANAEQRLLVGEHRLDQIREHIARLREVERVADALTSASAKAAETPQGNDVTSTRPGWRARLVAHGFSQADHGSRMRRRRQPVDKAQAFPYFDFDVVNASEATRL